MNATTPSIIPHHSIHNPSEEGALNAAGVAILAWLKDLNFGAVFALSLFPYLVFLRNIWPKDYPIPTVRLCGRVAHCLSVCMAGGGHVCASGCAVRRLTHVPPIH